MTMQIQATAVASSTPSKETAPIVEQLPVGIFRKDAAGRFIFVNSRFCQLKATAADQILGRTAAEIAAGASQNPQTMWRLEPAEQEALQHAQTMQTGQQASREEVGTDADGRPQYLQVVESAVLIES